MSLMRENYMKELSSKTLTVKKKCFQMQTLTQFSFMDDSLVNKEKKTIAMKRIVEGPMNEDEQ